LTRNQHLCLNRRVTYHTTFLIVGGLLALMMYLRLAWSVFPPEALWSPPDEGAKLLQLQNLRLENGRFACDIAYVGRELDPQLQFTQTRQLFLRVHDGKLHYTSSRLPLFPLLTLPLFRWFGYYGLYLLPAIGGAISGVLALLLLNRKDRLISMWLLIAFASPIFVYSTLFWEHTLAISVVLAGAWLALHIRPLPNAFSSRSILGWMFVGIILGLGIYLRQELIFFALALLISYWVVVRDGKWGPVWAGAALVLVLLPYVPLHMAMFGQTIPDNIVYVFSPFHYLSSVGWKAIPDLLIGPLTEGSIDSGWPGILWSFVAIMTLAISFYSINSSMTRNLMLIGLGVTAIIAATFLYSSTFYYSAHGLLFTTPWVLLGLCRSREVWQHGDWRAKIVVLTTIFGLLGYIIAIVVFRLSSPHGGVEWGARFAMVFYPLLALIAAWNLGSRRREIKTLIIVGAFVFLGISFQLRGLWVVLFQKQFNNSLNQVILELPEYHIVSDIWWMPLNAATIYPKKAIFLASTPEKIGSWVKLAAFNRIHQFSLVTFKDDLLNDVAQFLDEPELRIVETERVGGVFIFRVAIENE
jgi:hypothetical protein